MFTSEVGEGDLSTLGELRPELRDREHARSLVIGSIRETLGTDTVYALFCVEPATARVYLVDVDPPYHARFVNSGVEALIESLQVFVSGWPSLAASDDDTVGSVLEDLRAQLTAVDAVAFVDAAAYWSEALEGHS